MSNIEKEKYDYIHKLYSGYGNSIARIDWLNSDKRLSDSIKKIISNSKHVLDVGCGKGLIIDFFKRINKNVSFAGVDISEVAVNSRKDLDLHIADVNKIPFQNNYFDVVYFFDGMEHITKEYERKSILEMLRVSKEYVILKISHINSSEDEQMIKNGYTPLHINVESNIYWFNVFANLEKEKKCIIHECFCSRGLSIYILKKR